MTAVAIKIDELVVYCHVSCAMKTSVELISICIYIVNSSLTICPLYKATARKSIHILFSMSVLIKPELIRVPRLIITLLLSSTIYILIIISCLCVMGFKNTVHNESPLTKMYELLYNPQIGFLAYIAGLIIMFNTAFLSALTATRFMYSCGDKNHIMFSDFWKQLNSNKVPENAIIVSALIAIVFSLFNNEVILAIFTNFSLFIILISLCASLLILRWNERNNSDKQKANNYIWGNINNIPVIVVLQIIILAYLFYKILINRFYYNYTH